MAKLLQKIKININNNNIYLFRKTVHTLLCGFSLYHRMTWQASHLILIMLGKP